MKNSIRCWRLPEPCGLYFAYRKYFVYLPCLSAEEELPLNLEVEVGKPGAKQVSRQRVES